MFMDTFPSFSNKTEVLTVPINDFLVESSLKKIQNHGVKLLLPRCVFGHRECLVSAEELLGDDLEGIVVVNAPVLGRVSRYVNVLTN